MEKGACTDMRPTTSSLRRRSVTFSPVCGRALAGGGPGRSVTALPRFPRRRAGVEDRGLFDDNWIYIHEPGVKVGRIQNFKSWSPEMVPDERSPASGWSISACG